MSSTLWIVANSFGVDDESYLLCGTRTREAFGLMIATCCGRIPWSWLNVPVLRRAQRLQDAWMTKEDPFRLPKTEYFDRLKLDLDAGGGLQVDGLDQASLPGLQFLQRVAGNHVVGN